MRSLLLAAGVASAAAFSVAPLPATSAAVRARAASRMADDAEEDGPWTGAQGWSEQFKEPEPVFDVLAVKNILPHRYPFLLVDKIIDFVPGKKAVGIKKVTTNEEL